MILLRRDALRAGGGLLAGLLFDRAMATEVATIDVEMLGNRDGSKVWFAPVGVLVRPGATLRWTNRDPGNSHTATAYHPANDGHAPRIPAAGTPWNSDYLLPEKSFSVTLTVPGVYDYYCVPHEHAGMVGRIVVTADGDPLPEAAAGNPLPDLGYDPFPTVEEIVRSGSVFRN